MPNHESELKNSSNESGVERAAYAAREAKIERVSVSTGAHGSMWGFAIEGKHGDLELRKRDSREICEAARLANVTI